MATTDPTSTHTGRNGLTPVGIVAAIDERLFQRLDLIMPPAVSRAYAAVLAAVLMGARIDISTVERVVDATLESAQPAEKNGYGFAIKGGWRIVPGAVQHEAGFRGRMRPRRRDSRCSSQLAGSGRSSCSSTTVLSVADLTDRGVSAVIKASVASARPAPAT